MHIKLIKGLCFNNILIIILSCRPNVIRLGEEDFSSTTETQSFDYKISKIDVHSRYRFPIKYHDIAVSSFMNNYK